MLRTSLALQFGIACLTAGIAMAQPGRGDTRGGASRGGGSVPAVGTSLPDVNVFDETGAPLSTASLHGNYSVLVFGCLT